MQIFKSQDKLAEVVEMNPKLLPVINRFDIALGIGNKTIEDICSEKNIEQSFFLAIINTYHNPDFFQELEQEKISPLELVNYLRKTHEYYLKHTIPKLDELLDRLIESCRDSCGNIQMIKTFYNKYKKELKTHIDDEEKRVFPYIETLIERKQKSTEFTIHNFEEEHTNVEEKINDLKNLIIRHIEPSYEQNTGNEFLFELFRFEKDIRDHARIEDNLLIPMVENIEKQLAK